MTCTTCKSGELFPGKTTVTLERDGCLVIFRDAPAHVCENCGSYVLDVETTKILFNRAEESIEKGVEMEVIRLKAA
jgi:YgiT-type zinc finger domain-containing protein